MLKETLNILRKPGENDDTQEYTKLKAIFEEMKFLKDTELDQPSDDLSIESMEWYEQNAIQIYETMFSTSQLNQTLKKTLIDNSRSDYGEFVRYTGRLYTFRYEPESDRLDYWDKYPLVLRMLDESDSNTSFLGMNLHYLDPMRRRMMFMSLVERYLTGSLSNPNSRIGYLNMQKLMVPPNRYGRVCIRRYKYDNIRGKPLLIPPEHWMKMIFLPTYHFIGAKPNRVWKDSWKKYRRMT